MMSTNLLKGSLAAFALFVLAGCGPTEEEIRIGEEASAVHARLEQVAGELAGIKADLTGFLVSDARAIKSCQVKQESDLITHTFDALEQDVAAHLSASESLAQAFAPDSAYATADEQLAAHRAMVTKAEKAKAGAEELAELLRASVTERARFKQRADKAVSRIFESSKSVVPLYNYQKTVPNKADTADKRMSDLNQQVAQAIRLKDGIEAGYAAVKQGELLNCSAWAVDVVRLEHLATAVDAEVAKLKTEWRFAE